MIEPRYVTGYGALYRAGETTTELSTAETLEMLCLPRGRLAGPGSYSTQLSMLITLRTRIHVVAGIGLLGYGRAPFRST